MFKIFFEFIVTEFSNKYFERVNKEFIKLLKKTEAWKKDSILYEVQKYYIRRSKNIEFKQKDENTRKQFIKELIQFGKKNKLFCDKFIQVKIKEIRNEAKANYTNKISIEVKKMLANILHFSSKNQFHRLIEYIKNYFELYQIEEVENMKINAEEELKFMELLNERRINIEDLTNRILDRIKIKNLKKIIDDKQNQFEICGHSCFICGAPCRKDPNHIHSENPEERKHYTPFHIPTVFLGKKIFPCNLKIKPKKMKKIDS